MAIDTLKDRRSALGLYVFDSGGISVPTAPVLSYSHFNDTEAFLVWTMPQDVTEYQLWYKESGGVYARFPDASTTFNTLNAAVTGLTAETDYVFKVTAVNGAGSTDSNELELTTAAATPILTRIESEGAGLMEGMTIANGYNFDWGNSNDENLATKDAYPTGDMRAITEENQDEIDATHAHAYSNRVQIEITITSKIPAAEATAAGSKNNFDVKAYHNKALDDLKKLFGLNPSINDTCNFMYYKGYTRELEKVAGDLRIPGRLITRWEATYSQDRAVPTLNAN